MKIKKEEINIKTEEIEKEKIKEEAAEDVVPESSFRASLSRFAYPSSPPSSARRSPKRPSPDDSNPNPPPFSPFLTVTVAPVAQPTPGVPQGGRDNEEPGPEDVASRTVQVLRRSPRKRKGETRLSVDTGGDGGGTHPPKKKRRRGNPPRASEEDLSHLGALPEYLAEDLDGTFLLTPLAHMLYFT